MKKYILMPLVALAAFTACQDFLVEAPVMSQSNELVLSTYEGLDKAVAGAYAPLASTSWYGADFVLINELKTSNGKKWIGSNWDSGRCNDLYNLNYNPNNTSALWGTAYYVISAVNNVLDNLEGKENPDVTAQDLNNLKAECLFLRALSHFDLVRTYAQPYCYNLNGADGAGSHLGVPVVLKTDSAAKPARNTVKEVYAQVVADLLEAEKLIDPSYARAGVTDKKAVVTLPAIQALLSRVYLYSENWQGAADYASKVIKDYNYTLWTPEDFEDAACYAEDAPAGGEVIFEVYGLKANTYDGYHDGLSPMCGPDGYGDAGASTDLKAIYEEGDVRGTLFQEEDGVLWTAKYIGKGLSDPDVTNTIVIRLSEMYLNLAEAVVRGAKGYNAPQALADLAAQRGATAQNATLEGVWLERQKELAWEAHYWFDLGRTKRNMTRTDFVGDEKAKDLEWGNYKWAMPIPLREFGTNPNLVQNDGYGK